MRFGWLNFLLLLQLSGSIAFGQSSAPGIVFRDCPDCPEMVVVPAGRFKMGLLGGGAQGAIVIPGEFAFKDVSIGYAFAVGRFELTRGQFSLFLSSSGSNQTPQENCSYIEHVERTWRNDDKSRSLSTPGFAQTDDHPVVCVSWLDAKAYVDWISRQTGKQYRLLSESEWEYVARDGSEALRPWGDIVHDACRHANVWDETFQRVFRRPGESPGTYHGGFGCSDGYVYTAPVGQFVRNAFGVFDMIGNVWEWVEDCLNLSLEGGPTDGSVWRSGNCGIRVLRGGSWASNFPSTHPSHRFFRRVSFRAINTGFRVARDL